MSKIECSFCGKSYLEPLSKTRIVAGPRVFICRDCVGLCVEIFAGGDAHWRDEKIKELMALRDRPK